MPSTGLHGPYALTAQNIDAVVGKSIGTYALTREASGQQFVVRYVGRSDSDVNKRLKDYVGTTYLEFKYGHFPSAKAAFEHECRMFHDFGEEKLLDNDIHPRRPDGSGWKCPSCKIFG